MSPSIGPLLGAMMDLRLVQMLRDAMRTADCNASRGVHLRQHQRLEPTPPFRSHPMPKIEPRTRISPTPRFESRPVIHPTPRPLPAPEPVADSSSVPEHTHRLSSPIQPPWKTMAWQVPPQAPVKTKVVIRQPEVIRKGSLLDIFI